MTSSLLPAVGEHYEPRRIKMKVIIFFFLFVSTVQAYPDKDKDIEQFICLQQEIFKIAKRHHQNLFKNGTSNLNNAVEIELKKRTFEKLKSEQLYRLGIACALTGYPQAAGDQRWDLVFNEVAWKCVHILSSRPGYKVRHYMKNMKTVFGTDGHPSHLFKEYIKKQSSL